MNRVKFGAYVVSKRKALGLTQGELARRAGVGRRSVIRIEQGASNPSLATVNALLAALADVPSVAHRVDAKTRRPA